MKCQIFFAKCSIAMIFHHFRLYFLLDLSYIGLPEDNISNKFEMEDEKLLHITFDLQTQHQGKYAVCCASFSAPGKEEINNRAMCFITFPSVHSAQCTHQTKIQQPF